MRRSCSLLVLLVTVAATSRCSLIPGELKGAGQISSTTTGNAQFAFTALACAPDPVAGTFTYRDGTTDLKGSITRIGKCAFDDVSRTYDCACPLDIALSDADFDDLYFAEVDYTSKNKKAPGSGTAIACADDNGEVGNPDELDLVSLDILTGPFAGYSNLDLLSDASIKSGPCQHPGKKRTATPAPTNTAAPTETPTPAPSATPSPSPTATNAPTETPTPRPTATPTSQPMDTCFIAGVSYPAGTPNPANPCSKCRPEISTSDWSNATPGESCNDGNTCTIDDSCTNGICSGTDACAGCVIAGESHPAGTPNPANACLKCRPEISTSDWSNAAPGESCDDGDACTFADSCVSGICVGTSSADAYEPNDSRIGTNIDGVDACASPSSQSLTATLWGPGDTDWYWFHDAESAGCSERPDVQLTNIPSSADLDLDVYWVCANGAIPTSFSCALGSATGGFGCRSENAGTTDERVTIDACCTSGCTGDDSGYLEVNVFKASGTTTCDQSYTLSWGDD